MMYSRNIRDWAGRGFWAGIGRTAPQGFGALRGCGGVRLLMSEATARQAGFARTSRPIQSNWNQLKPIQTKKTCGGRRFAVRGAMTNIITGATLWSNQNCPFAMKAHRVPVSEANQVRRRGRC